MSTPSSPRPWVFGVIALVLLVGLTVIGVQFLQPRSQAQTLELYYSDVQAMYLVPVEQSSEVATAHPSVWAEDVVGRLRQAPDSGLVSALSPDIKLLEAGYQAPEWRLKLQVGPGFGSLMERLVVGSMVRTFVASYPGAERAEVRLVDAKGKPYEGQHLDLSRPLTVADFVNRLEGGTPANLNATVWWRSPNTAHLVPIQVPMAGKAGSLPQDVFQQLVGGPPAASQPFLASVVPAGVKATWAGMEGTVARVAIEGTLPTGPDGERFVRATVLSLTEQAPIDAVQFMQGGKPLAARVGSFDLAGPVHRPEAANPVTAPAQAAHP